jgi:hypothetical protein
MLALKLQEEAMNLGLWAASISWRKKEIDSPLGLPEGT